MTARLEIKVERGVHLERNGLNSGAGARGAWRRVGQRAVPLPRLCAGAALPRRGAGGAAAPGAELPGPGDLRPGDLRRALQRGRNHAPPGQVGTHHAIGGRGKHPEKWRSWSPHLGRELHSRQLQIALRAMALLKVGGLMPWASMSL